MFRLFGIETLDFVVSHRVGHSTHRWSILHKANHRLSTIAIKLIVVAILKFAETGGGILQWILTQSFFDGIFVVGQETETVF